MPPSSTTPTSSSLVEWPRFWALVVAVQVALCTTTTTTTTPNRLTATLIPRDPRARPAARRRIEPIPVTSLEPEVKRDCVDASQAAADGQAAPGGNRSVEADFGGSGGPTKNDINPRQRTGPSSLAYGRFNESEFYASLAERVESSARRYVSQCRQRARKTGKRMYSGYDDGGGFIDDSELFFQPKKEFDTDPMEVVERQRMNEHVVQDEQRLKGYEAFHTRERDTWKKFAHALLKLPENVTKAVKVLREAVLSHVEKAHAIEELNSKNANELPKISDDANRTEEALISCKKYVFELTEIALKHNKLIRMKPPTLTKKDHKPKVQKGTQMEMDDDDEANIESQQSKKFKIEIQKVPLLIERPLWMCLKTFLNSCGRMRVQRLFHHLYWQEELQRHTLESAKLLHELKERIKDRVKVQEREYKSKPPNEDAITKAIEQGRFEDAALMMQAIESKNIHRRSTPNGKSSRPEVFSTDKTIDDAVYTLVREFIDLARAMRQLALTKFKGYKIRKSRKLLGSLRKYGSPRKIISNLVKDLQPLGISVNNTVLLESYRRGLQMQRKVFKNRIHSRRLQVEARKKLLQQRREEKNAIRRTKMERQEWQRFRDAALEERKKVLREMDEQTRTINQTRRAIRSTERAIAKLTVRLSKLRRKYNKSVIIQSSPNRPRSDIEIDDASSALLQLQLDEGFY